MSSLVFQRALADVVLGRDPARLPAPLARALDARERMRLRALAGGAGLRATRALHEGFRLAKLLQLVPWTARVLGPRRMLRAARGFWRVHPPVSFYYHDEAIAFCEHLAGAGRPARAPHCLAEVVAFERARIELARVRPPGAKVPTQRVRFEHDPARLLLALERGGVPRRLRRLPCVLVLEAGPGAGAEAPQWRVERVSGA